MYRYMYIYRYLYVYDIRCIEYTPLRWSWIFLKQTQILNRFQCTRHVIEFVFGETNQFVSSNPNVSLTRQTCGQRSNMTTGNKHQALAFDLSIRIC